LLYKKGIPFGVLQHKSELMFLSFSHTQRIRCSGLTSQFGEMERRSPLMIRFRALFTPVMSWIWHVLWLEVSQWLSDIQAVVAIASNLNTNSLLFHWKLRKLFTYSEFFSFRIFILTPSSINFYRLPPAKRYLVARKETGR